MGEYKKNMIKKFIFRVDFVSDIDELKTSVPTSLASKIISNFPNSIMTDVVESEIQIHNNDIQKKDNPFKQWQYISSDTTDKITITPKSLIYDSNQYKSFDNILSKFMCIVKEILNLKNVQIGRIGLRYINVFSALDFQITEIEDWKKFVEPELINYLKFMDNEVDITNMVNSVEYSFGDFRLKYKSGFSNKNYPLKLIKPDFTLDCDGYSNAVVTSFNDFQELVENIHSKIELIFEKSITKTMRGFLNG